MALPDDCETPVAPCCTTLYDLVACLVDAAADAVEDCLGEQCEEFFRFVLHGGGTGPGDFVSGQITDVRPAPARQSATGAKQLFAIPLLVTVQIRLVEKGYPVIDITGGEISKPTSAQFDYAATHSYSHGEKALRAMLNAARAACGGPCQSVQLLFGMPESPEAYLAAWRWDFVATWNP